MYVFSLGNGYIQQPAQVYCRSHRTQSVFNLMRTICMSFSLENGYIQQQAQVYCRSHRTQSVFNLIMLTICMSFSLENGYIQQQVQVYCPSHRTQSVFNLMCMLCMFSAWRMGIYSNRLRFTAAATGPSQYLLSCWVQLNTHHTIPEPHGPCCHCRRCSNWWETFSEFI